MLYSCLGLSTSSVSSCFSARAFWRGVTSGLSIEDDDEPDDVEELPPLEEDNDEGSKMEEVD